MVNQRARGDVCAREVFESMQGQHNISSKPNVVSHYLRENGETSGVTLPLSLPDVILASRFSTRLSLLNPSPSLGISSSPLRLISPRAVTAAIVSKGVVLSKNDPTEEIARYTLRQFCVKLSFCQEHISISLSF